jgi:hypothetical protein
MKFSRSKNGFVILALPIALMMQGDAVAAETCLCKAHFELRPVVNGRPNFDASFKPDIPVDHFSAAKGKGAGTMNACRRGAQQAANSCMQKIWEKRWSAAEDTGNYEQPAECSTSRGIRGSVPYNIKTTTLIAWQFATERNLAQSQKPRSKASTGRGKILVKAAMLGMVLGRPAQLHVTCTANANRGPGSHPISKDRNRNVGLKRAFPTSNNFLRVPGCGRALARMSANNGSPLSGA